MGPDNKRVVLATAITVAIMLLLNSPMFFGKKPVPAPPGQPAATAAKAPEAAQGQPAAAPAPAAVAPVPRAEERLATLKGKDFQVTFSSWGGSLKSVQLTSPKFQRVEEGKKGAVPEPIELVAVEPGSARPLAVLVSRELGGSGLAPLADPAAQDSMELSADARSVTFTGREGAVGLRKTWRLTDRPYELALELEVTDAPAAGTVSLLIPGFMPPSTSSGGFFSGPALDFLRPVCRAGDKTERFKMDGDDATLTPPGAAGWAGIDRHYFTSVVLPQPAAEGSCTFVRGETKGSGAAILQVPVGPGTSRKSFLVFTGPKQLDLLKAYNRAFESVIDYGPVTNLFALFAQVLLNVMRWFHGFIGNWGAAIILLTLSVKLLLYPLTLKSMQSMAAMRKLQPEIEKLKAKHGDDKEKLNVAVMQMYQQHKVNPLGGCLPMLLQMPIWFALYAALQTSVELYREPFLWMSDLTLKDPYFILPVAMGVTSFLMQKLSPQPADNTQAKMMLYFFPAFFSFMMLFVPSGLTLYIFVNNLLSIGQQQLVNRMQEKAAA